MCGTGGVIEKRSMLFLWKKKVRSSPYMAFVHFEAYDRFLLLEHIREDDDIPVRELFARTVRIKVRFLLDFSMLYLYLSVSV